MRLSADAPFIHPDCEIREATFGAYCEVGRGSRVQKSDFLDYAYCDRYADIANTTVGKFANIAAFTRIGPTDHPMERASLHHFLYRTSYYWHDLPDDAAFFAARAARRTVLLDAQDWMNDTQLNDLWREITRTAKPGARVIFRTAAEPSVLPGRVTPDVLAKWEYLAEQSADLHAKDRSSIYGGFHIYALNEAAQ